MLLKKELDFSFEGDPYYKRVTNIETPNKCPLCHAHIEPVYLHLAIVNNSVCTVQYFCNACSKVFLTDYKFTLIEDGMSYKNECLDGQYHSYPIRIKERNFSDNITSVSNDFIEIYNQSFEAELMNLDRIAGVGYRKSLEFLVKDYAKHLSNDSPEVISSIEKKNLSQCITDYIIHPQIVDILKRATWIGNDETHYIRDHPQENIETLKALIDISLTWIDLDLSTKELSDRIIHPKDR